MTNLQLIKIWLIIIILIKKSIIIYNNSFFNIVYKLLIFTEFSTMSPYLSCHSGSAASVAILLAKGNCPLLV